MANGSDFVKNYLDMENKRIQEEDAAAEKEANDKASVEKYNTAISSYLKGYGDWAKKNNGKYANASAEDLEKRVRNLVKTAGTSDGVLNDNSTDAEIAEYGTKFLNTLSGLKEDGSEYKFQDYLKEYGNEETKEAAKRQIKAAAAQAYLDKLGGDASYMRQAYNSDVQNADEAIRLANQRSEGDYKWLNTSKTQYNTWKETQARDLYGMFDNYDTQKPITDKKSEVAKDKADKTDAEKASEKKKDSADDGTTGEEVTFTLPKANDPNYRGFGQKLVDLGLATSKGLWGPDGDVAFYNKQLHDQGIYGNLPIGVPIKLKKRKV